MLLFCVNVYISLLYYISLLVFTMLWAKISFSHRISSNKKPLFARFFIYNYEKPFINFVDFFRSIFRNKNLFIVMRRVFNSLHKLLSSTNKYMAHIRELMIIFSSFGRSAAACHRFSISLWPSFQRMSLPVGRCYHDSRPFDWNEKSPFA